MNLMATWLGFPRAGIDRGEARSPKAVPVFKNVPELHEIVSGANITSLIYSMYSCLSHHNIKHYRSSPYREPATQPAYSADGSTAQIS